MVFSEYIIQGHPIVQSMSGKGNCWDNAVTETLFRSLKTEWLYHVDLKDLDHAERELFEYIELFYNNQRLHASLGLLVSCRFRGYDDEPKSSLVVCPLFPDHIIGHGAELP